MELLEIIKGQSRTPWTDLSLLCAEGACFPGHIQRALAGSAQMKEDQDWAPSCCERSQGKDLGWGPTLRLGRGQDRGRDPDGEYPPWEDQVLTSPWISCSWEKRSKQRKKKKKIRKIVYLIYRIN